MLENIVNQEAARFIAADIKRNILPRSILFSGKEADGKLSAALETARILSCHSEDKEKSFNCKCPSCLQQKALTCSNLMLLGPRDCFLEICAAKKTFLDAVKNHESFEEATRYLFLRAVRKLTLRFNSILWQGETNLNKVGTLMEVINENLELLDFPRSLPDYETLEKICENLVDKCKTLEDDYLYSSIPINQIRNLENWAHIKSEEGKKTIIIENADKMLPAVRNALLKILEEPPADVQVILLTNNRSAIMETILSRVRTYNFKQRNTVQQKKVLNLVFHADFEGTINDYLLEFLPVNPQIVKEQAEEFFKAVKNRKIPDINSIVKKCGNFNPVIELKIFLNAILTFMSSLKKYPLGCEVAYEVVTLLKKTYENITLYNQNTISALDTLLRDLSALNVKNGCIFSLCEIM